MKAGKANERRILVLTHDFSNLSFPSLVRAVHLSALNRRHIRLEFLRAPATSVAESMRLISEDRHSMASRHIANSPLLRTIRECAQLQT
jgi:hypothetical protein